MSDTRARHKRQQGAGRKPGFTPPQPWKWEPMTQGELVVDPALQELAEQNPDVAEALEGVTEVWLNNHYVVTVRRFPTGQPDVMSLSIRSLDRSAAHDWRDFQRIKNEIAGRNVNGFEVYPSWDRTVDTANQYWVWCLRPGVELPVGFSERAVSGDNDPQFPMSRQRSFRRGEKEAI